MLSPHDAAAACEDAVDTLRRAGCVFAEREVDLLRAEADDLPAFRRMLARRAAGLPLEWVVGWADFCDLRVAIDEGVFVPRRRTQRLAAIARDQLRQGDHVLDLGCGSGALALVLAATGLPASVTACDVDPRAVASARRALAGWPARVLESDLFEGLPDGQQFDVIVANLPYVPTSQLGFLPNEARCHEPTISLDGGVDGLGPLRRAAPAIAGRLSTRGTFLTELHTDQVAAASNLLGESGLVVTDRVAGDGTRVLLARRPQ